HARPPAAAPASPACARPATARRAAPAAPAWSCRRRAAPPAPGADAARGIRGSAATAGRWGMPSPDCRSDARVANAFPVPGAAAERYRDASVAPTIACMDLIDIGVNLGHDSFDHDRDAVMERARAAGVRRMVVTGASREGSPKALALAQAHPGVLFATAGVHPHHASEYTDECHAELLALHAHPEVVAVGECGLDYFRDFSPRPAQRKAFERQLEIAAGNGKPLFLHQRDAHDDFMGVMREFEGRLGPAVVHCFTGSREELF